MSHMTMLPHENERQFPLHTECVNGKIARFILYSAYTYVCICRVEFDSFLSIMHIIALLSTKTLHCAVVMLLHFKKLQQ